MSETTLDRVPVRQAQASLPRITFYRRLKRLGIVPLKVGAITS